MKYDLTKCNNLNFRLNDGTTGFIKVSPSNDVYLYSSDKREWDKLRAMPGYKMIARVTNGNSAAAYLAELGLKIIPRNPETYTDWKVGDVLKDIVNPRDLFIIQARLGDMVLISDITRYYGYTYTSKCITEKCKLVLTDYEQEILKAQDEKKAKECPFRKGDRVLVRDKNEDAWIFETFDRYEASFEYIYKCEFDYYRQCIPYNERTWQLLGTTDEYKEEE